MRTHTTTLSLLLESSRLGPGVEGMERGVLPDETDEMEDGRGIFVALAPAPARRSCNVERCFLAERGAGTSIELTILRRGVEGESGMLALLAVLEERESTSPTRGREWPLGKRVENLGGLVGWRMPESGSGAGRPRAWASEGEGGERASDWVEDEGVRLAGMNPDGC